MRTKPRDRHWKEELKDLFSMHAAERRGMTILMTLCLIAAGWVVYAQWIAPHPEADLEEVDVEWAQLNASAGSSAVEQRSDKKLVKEDQLFNFDPNHLPLEQWVALGLSERQAASIHRYEAKGGSFRTKRDLAKMFVVTPDLFASWEPFILLPDTVTRSSANSEPATQEADLMSRPPRDEDVDRSFSGRHVLEINTADTNALIALPGIGPAFARGIVKYRQWLGGYHDLDQLKEVHILRDKPDAVEKLKSLLVVDTLMMVRHPINSFTAEQLGPHPYAGWKVAKALVAYRAQHGPFKQVADIKGCVLVTDSVYRKLAPYLSAE